MSNNNIGQTDDARFPNDGAVAALSDNKGPGATAENPGNVHPVDNVAGGQKYMPSQNAGQQGHSIFHAVENPYAMREALNKLESALEEVISLFQNEGKTLSADGDFSAGKEGIKKFQAWRQEIEEIKAGQQ